MTQSSHQLWLREKLAERCIENLKKHAFDAHFLPTAADALSLVLEETAGLSTFGFGGSDTVRAIGIPDALKARGKTVYDHWEEGLSKKEDLDLRLKMGRCDAFFCSANAISLTGEVVNVDGVGNRTNAMTFGPGRVFVISGMNKVTPDLDTALSRVREAEAEASEAT